MKELKKGDYSLRALYLGLIAKDCNSCFKNSMLNIQKKKPNWKILTGYK